LPFDQLIALTKLAETLKIKSVLHPKNEPIEFVGRGAHLSDEKFKTALAKFLDFLVASEDYRAEISADTSNNTAIINVRNIPTDKQLKLQEGLALGAKENEELKLVKTKVQMGTIRSQANNMINMKGSIAATLATRRSNAVPTSVTYAMQVKAMVDYAQQMLQSPYFLVEPGARAVIATNIDEIHRNVYPRIDALYIAAVRSGKKKLEGDLLDTLILLESAGNNIFRQCRAVETKIEETGHRLKKDMEKMREENKKPSALPWVNIGIAATISVLAIALRQPSLINFLLLAPLLYACYRLHEGGHQLENLWKGKTTKIVTTNLEWWNSGRTVPFASGKSGIIASAAGAVLFIVLALALPDFSRLLTVAVLINVAFLFSGADWDEMLQRRVIKQSIISAETHVSTATLFDKSRDISNEFSRLNPRDYSPSRS
jgi:hypothetical protein